MVKEVPQNSFSAVLAEAMQHKGVSTEKLARETGISERFLRLMLEEKLDRLPPAPYLHGYIMKIAEKLELDGEKIWETYFKDNKYLKSSGVTDRLPKNRFAISRTNKRILIIALVIVAIAGYFIIRTFLSFDISRELTLEGFEDNMVVSQEDTYALKGNVSPGLRLTVNDTPIYPDKDGDFERDIELEPGFNTLTFKLEGLFNKKEKLTKQVYYQAGHPKEENLPGAATTTQETFKNTTSTPENGGITN